MKTSSQINILIVLIFSLLLSNSCSKERIEPEEEEEEELNEYNTMNDYFDAKKQEEQEFVIDTSGTDPIIGNQGTKVWPSKEKLMFANGDSVHWPYTVNLIELYTPKDMIYYQMPTIAGGELLTTGGEIRLRAFKDGQELVLRPNKTWTVEMPNTAPVSNMEIYYGVENSTYVDWTANPAGVFTTTAYGYLGNIAQLGWVACGKDAGITATTTNYTFASTTDNLQNLSIFIYFPNLESLMQVYSLTSGDIPIGEDIKIILMGIDSGDNLFYYFSDTQVSSSSQIDVILTAISDADLTVILDGL